MKKGKGHASTVPRRRSPAPDVEDVHNIDAIVIDLNRKRAQLQQMLRNTGRAAVDSSTSSVLQQRELLALGRDLCAELESHPRIRALRGDVDSLD